MSIDDWLRLLSFWTKQATEAAKQHEGQDLCKCVPRHAFVQSQLLRPKRLFVFNSLSEKIIMKTVSKLQILATLCAAIGSTQVEAQIANNVTISGVVDAYLGTRQLAGGISQTKVDSSGLTTSQVNIMGTEDLGDGNRAEFALGMFFRPDDGGQGRFSGDVQFGRASYVGLGGQLGTIRVGRQATGTFLNFIRTNSFGDSTVFSPAFIQTWISAVAQGSQFLSGGAPATNRTLTNPLGTSDTTWDNVVAYISPSIAGATFQAQWAPGETAGVGSRFGASTFYTNGPLALGLSTEQIGANGVPASGPAAAVISKQTNWQLSGAYAFGFGRVSAGLLTTQRDFALISDDRIRTVHLGVSIPVGMGTVMAQVANSSEKPDVGTEMIRTTTSVGYSYAFSKRTDAYVVLMNDRFTGQSSGNSFGVGVRQRF